MNAEDVEFISEVEEAYEFLLTRRTFPQHELVMMFPPEVPMTVAAENAVDTANEIGKTVLLAHNGYSLIVMPGTTAENVLRMVE